MALSVLILPNTLKALRKDQSTTHGLWDRNKNDYITFGSEDKCYAVKHTLEQIEQSNANAEWRERFIAEHMDLLTKAGYDEATAKTIIYECLAEHGKTK